MERLNYVQYYPVVVFFAPESRAALKALRAGLAPASRRSSRRLFAQAQKLQKHSAHLFTGAGGAGRGAEAGLPQFLSLTPRPYSHHPPAWYR